VSTASLCYSTSLVTLQRPRLPDGSPTMARGSRTSDGVSAPGEAMMPSSIAPNLRAPEVLPCVTLSLCSVFGGRWNEEEGQ
jgi:hypothetical protein